MVWERIAAYKDTADKLGDSRSFTLMLRFFGITINNLVKPYRVVAYHAIYYSFSDKSIAITEKMFIFVPINKLLLWIIYI
jgi:hypothetical protein